jgi:hypothetical protein
MTKDRAGRETLVRASHQRVWPPVAGPGYREADEPPARVRGRRGWRVSEVAVTRNARYGGFPARGRTAVPPRRAAYRDAVALTGRHTERSSA